MLNTNQAVIETSVLLHVKKRISISMISCHNICEKHTTNYTTTAPWLGNMGVVARATLSVSLAQPTGLLMHECYTFTP